MKTKVILCLLLGAAAASAVWLLLPREEVLSPTARITRDGALLEEIDLTRVEEPYTLVVEDSQGSNTLQVERGRIRVLEADCPDQVCVRQGWVQDRTVPIVCLPHRLVIEIVGGEGELDGGAG
ncbi:NusG domain II-containing protein [Oscillospiraceae bacterium 50-16]|jgi:hypothetical protein|nr:NusG domain II-containing protein [Lawsonibacter sp.]